MSSLGSGLLGNLMGGVNQEEDEQQEDDIGHRGHAEHRQGIMLSLECHSFFWFLVLSF